MVHFTYEFSQMTFATSLRTALLLCCKPMVAIADPLFSSDAALLEFARTPCFRSCLKKGFEEETTSPEVPKALARALVIRTVGSSTLAAFVFSLFIFAYLVEEQ